MASSALPMKVIVAATARGGIGKGGSIPWGPLKEDMARFVDITSSTADAAKRNAVIMGRKTWASIPAKFRPLKSRLNVVLTRQPPAEARKSENIPSDVLVANSLEAALAMLTSSAEATTTAPEVESVFVMGGASLYSEALQSPATTSVYMTHLAADAEIDCDTHLAPWPIDASQYTLSAPVSEVVTDAKTGLRYVFAEYARLEAGVPAAFAPVATGAVAASSSDDPPSPDKVTAALEDVSVREASASGAGAGEGDTTSAAPMTTPARSTPSNEVVPRGIGADGINHEEMQYLDIIRDIIDTGVTRSDRTGTGTISKFGVKMRFSLRDNVLPLLTTKRVFWRGLAQELLWFVAGSTNANELADKGIHIWDGNGSREFLDSRGLTDREVGDLGPVYGFQWRHFGAEYGDFKTDYTGKGVDQLAACITKIKENPTDRRILLSAWNPADLDKMALPPCHMFCQFYVADGELSCQMYQRSADMGLGVPFNIASYALLTRMVAQVCDLKAGDFVHVIGDAHVYLNHVEPLKEQLKRAPYAFPTLTIDPSVTDIDDFRYEHFDLNKTYKCHPTIKMTMAV